MGIAQNIAKNTSLILVSSLVQKALSLVLVILIVRLLGVSGFGFYSFIIAFGTFTGILTKLGLDDLNVRDVSGNHRLAAENIGTSIVLKLILTIVTFILSVIVLLALSYPIDTVILVLLASFAIFLESIAGSFRLVFVSYQRMEFEVIIGIISKLVLFIASVLVLFMGAGVFGLILATIISSALALLLSVYFCVRYFVSPILKKRAGLVKSMFFRTIPFSFIWIFGIIFAKIDILMLSFFHGDIATGLYSVPVRLIESLAIIITSFSTAIFPVMANLFSKKNQEFSRILEYSVKIVLVIMVPITIGITLLAERIIVSIFGLEFASAAIALQFLAWYALFNYVSVIFVNHLNSMHKEKIVVLLTAFTVGLNVVLNFLFIPTHGFLAAAITTLISQALFFVIAYRIIMRNVSNTRFIRMSIKPFIAAGVMAVVLLFFFYLNLIVLIVISAGVYLAVFLLIRGLDREEIEILKKVMKRVR
jgi:O-antigen/teichoic acid export membrane protein